MRKLILTSLFILSVQVINAQINAVTENGDEVLLYEDGTWAYTDEDATENPEVPVNKTKFKRDKNSSFLVKSKNLNIGIYINPKEWSFSKGAEDEAYEYQFEKKGEDLYGMLISEKVQIPIESLKSIAFETARSAAPDMKIVKEEYRNVNGIQVLLMQMAGTIQGMKLMYYGYYYSNENGTIQFLTYTGANLFDDYHDDIELFLNGLVEL